MGDSMTPGHPEFPSSEHNTPGVESTTGPLGQGVANAVGMAVAAKMAGARFNTPEHTLFDHSVVALCGDGCLQEGISAEGAAFAAHNGLDNLIYMFDSNDVTLDKMADFTQSEDIAMRFRAYGWDVETIDGHDLAALSAAYDYAKTAKNGKPKMIICKTIIAKGIDEVAGNNAGHGEAGVPYVAASKKKLGLPEKDFHVSEETTAFFKGHKDEPKKKYDAWQASYAAWKTANPNKNYIAGGGDFGNAGVKKVAMEAGVSGLWYKYADKEVGVDRFGISAPGDIVMEKFGMTAANLVNEAKAR